jgi:hypothetical protein
VLSARRLKTAKQKLIKTPFVSKSRHYKGKLKVARVVRITEKNVRKSLKSSNSVFLWLETLCEPNGFVSKISEPDVPSQTPAASYSIRHLLRGET